MNKFKKLLMTYMIVIKPLVALIFNYHYYNVLCFKTHNISTINRNYLFILIQNMFDYCVICMPIMILKP